MLKMPTRVTALGAGLILMTSSMTVSPAVAMDGSPFAEDQGKGLTQLDAKTVRKAFGLPDTTSDPLAANEWNLPVTAAEADRITYGIKVVQARKDRDLGAIVGKEPGSAGIEMDWANEQVIVRVKQGASLATRAAIDKLDLGWPVTIQSTTYSTAELLLVQDEIDGEYGAAGRLYSTGQSTSDNLVEVKTVDQATADEIGATYGDLVRAVAGAPIELYDGTAANCSSRFYCDPPIKGGSLIARGPTSVPCTTGFVLADVTTFDGVYRGAMATTAGHCWRDGYTDWSSGNGHMGTAIDYWGYTPGAVVNADVMFINIADSEDSNDVIDHAQSGNDYVIDITVVGCARETSAYCAEAQGDARLVSTGNSDIKYTTTLHDWNVTAYGDPFPEQNSTAVITKKHSRELNGNPFIGGDSGSPVYIGHTAHGGFFGGGGGYSYYSHIYYMLRYCANNGTICHVKTTA